MTTDKFVSALLSRYQAKLDAAVATGTLTASQAGTYMTNLRTRLTLWATMPFGK